MAGLKFRVLLDSKDQEKVFRDILISDTDNFESFYKAIISAFRFEGDQMASFYISNDEWDKGHEISLMDLSRPAVIGITTPGNKTILRKGKIGKDSGNSSLFISSSSSGVNNGINSASESNSWSDRLSIVSILWFDIKYNKSFCH